MLDMDIKLDQCMRSLIVVDILGFESTKYPFSIIMQHCCSSNEIVFVVKHFYSNILVGSQAKEPQI